MSSSLKRYCFAELTLSSGEAEGLAQVATLHRLLERPVKAPSLPQLSFGLWQRLLCEEEPGLILTSDILVRSLSSGASGPH